MILIIVESPAKCKKIESYLGNSYKCLASYGHIREFANGLKSIDYNNHYKSTYKISANKQKYVKILRAAIKKSSEVILATDDDREGEAIAWHICKVFNLPVKTTKRIIFHEITKKAILKAVNNPTTIDMKKVEAQQARQVLDLIVGFTTSPILWKFISRKTEKGLSAGRCQTPALRLVYENEQQCKSAKGENVYETLGTFTHKNIQYKLNHFFKTNDEIKSFLEKSTSHNHELSATTKKKMKKSPPKPFITSTLQQKASNMYNFSPKNTMKLAQTLYENGYITYMRTDNAKYSKDFIDSTKDYITTQWNTKYIYSKIDNICLKESKENTESKESSENKDEKTSGKKDAKDLAQEAHEAIRPTNIHTKTIQHNSKIGKYELKLYELIWKNALQSCMASSMYDVILSVVSTPEKHLYKNTTEKNIFPGWEILDGVQQTNDIYEYLYALFQSGKDNKKKVNYSEINSDMAIKKLKSHYTEARLVQLLEKNGIGRPSTFSSLVSKIIERNYVVKTNIPGKKLKCINYSLKMNEDLKEIQKTKIFGEEKNKLKIEPIGIVVIEFLNKYFDNMFNYEYTKEMEDHLDTISEGNYSLKKLCDSCRNELDLSISSITNNKNMDTTEKSFQKGIKIDENHTWIIGKYGPVIICNIEEKITFKKVKRDIDLDKLKNGEYKLTDILYESSSNGSSAFSKSLGEFNGEEITVKKGKFGLYCSYKGKNRSLKYCKKTLDNITIEDVKKILLSKSESSSKVLKNINETASIRQGKWGPYVYYKTDKMTKPRFIPIKKIAWKDVDIDWVYDNL
jgi:DNA topoisomerase I